MAKPVFYICAVLCIRSNAPGGVVYYVLTNAGVECFDSTSVSMPSMVRKYIDSNISRAVNLLPNIVLISDMEISINRG